MPKWTLDTLLKHPHMKLDSFIKGFKIVTEFSGDCINVSVCTKTNW